jgi:hypothetical protein
MTDRERVAHLLRRFGLGAGRYQLRPYEGLGPDRALEALLNDDKAPEPVNIEPWGFMVTDEGNLDGGAYRLGGWWGLRLLTTSRPFEQRLMVFWHDHFALDAEKVYEMPTMLGYLETLRTVGRGKFRDLLHAVCKQGALAQYLDNIVSNRLHPNENFAREVFELFTMGEGHYTETDVREAARAFTGWTMHYIGSYLQADYAKLSQTAWRQGVAMNNFAFVPGIHDPGEKTILGKTGRFNGDHVLDMLAAHPQTAKYVCAKLWEFFAGTKPSDAVLSRLTAAWERSDGTIKEVVRAIAKSPEFWSAEVVGMKPKSPVDWTVALFRQLDLGDIYKALAAQAKPGFNQPPKELSEGGGGVWYLMSQQGLGLLFPPDVGGWEWGTAWITTANTLQRIRHADVVFWGGGDERPLTMWLVNKIRQDGGAETPESLAEAFCDVFDVPVDDGRLQALVGVVTQSGGVAALADKNAAANLFARLGRTAFAVPEMQLC